MWLTCQDALTFIFNSATFSAQFWMCPRGHCAGKPVPFDTALGEETGGASGWVATTRHTQPALQTKINKIVCIHSPDTAKGGEQSPFFSPVRAQVLEHQVQSLFGWCRSATATLWALRVRELGGVANPCCGAKQIIKAGRKPSQGTLEENKGGEKKARKEVKKYPGCNF